MMEELTLEEALRQWRDLEKLGWGSYWDPKNEPKWARELTKSYANSWREIAYRRIASAFLHHMDKQEKGG